ncbi:MAG: stage II sporulation protein D [Bacilli bacterium]|nr:stage II sporulation protein D [Bacilli bacterium]MDD4282743.1 stage II sporulation protein D [Bacilli bacterium]MDD4718872.1 stage II sporulation protein D [Bacilli bacterium]
MINNHELIEVNNESELYLYVDFNYEFGIDFKEISNNLESFNEKIYKYLTEKEINFTKGKIFIVVGGVLLGTLFINNNQIQPTNNLQNNNYEIAEKVPINTPKIEKKEEVVEEQKKEVVEKKEVVTNTVKPTTPAIKKTEEKKITPKKSTPIVSKNQITIHRTNGQVINIELEDYIIGVVAAEMPASFNSEALKAQSVIARTYALKKLSKLEKLTDSTSHQVYKDNNQLKKLWGNDYSKYYNKIKQAVTSTAGFYLTFKGDYIEAVYHSTSNGKTEDSIAVWGNSFPYLKSVDSPWDLKASSYKREITKEFNTLKAITGIDITEGTEVKIISRTSGNRVNKVRIGNKVYTGVEFRTLLGLRSADFDITFENGKVVFTTFGFGHGVGMSQYGANGMANDGYNYKEIMSHYYPGTTLKK